MAGPATLGRGPSPRIRPNDQRNPGEDQTRGPMAASTSRKGPRISPLGVAGIWSTFWRLLFGLNCLLQLDVRDKGSVKESLQLCRVASLFGLISWARGPEDPPRLGRECQDMIPLRVVLSAQPASQFKKWPVSPSSLSPGNPGS